MNYRSSENGCECLPSTIITKEDLCFPNQTHKEVGHILMISGIAISVQRAENLSRWPIATHPRGKGCLRKERYSILLLYTETQLLTTDLLTDITSDTKTLRFRPLCS